MFRIYETIKACSLYGSGKIQCKTILPGNLLGFLMGTNFAPIASAMGGPNIKPLASTPAICMMVRIHKYCDHFAKNKRKSVISMMNQLKKWVFITIMQIFIVISS